ncbi:hypothetical protein ACHAWO_007039 [Cyclotella atomus]|uniref:Uncharacterized protein n=1 Tax=Cyclotella atomus TaxID=382360 RepID=A0ABD3MLZ6_9STRA
MNTNAKSQQSAGPAAGGKNIKPRKPLQDRTNDNGLNVQTRKNESTVINKRSSHTHKSKPLVMGPSNKATCSKKKTLTIKTVEVAESKLSERKRQSLPLLYPSNNDVKGKKLYSTNVKCHRSASTAGGRKITKSRKPLRDQTNDNGFECPNS